jgi:hypothetical protein
MDISDFLGISSVSSVPSPTISQTGIDTRETNNNNNNNKSGKNNNNNNNNNNNSGNSGNSDNNNSGNNNKKEKSNQGGEQKSKGQNQKQNSVPKSTLTPKQPKAKRRKINTDVYATVDTSNAGIDSRDDDNNNMIIENKQQKQQPKSVSNVNTLTATTTTTATATTTTTRKKGKITKKPTSVIQSSTSKKNQRILSDLKSIKNFIDEYIKDFTSKTQLRHNWGISDSVQHNHLQLIDWQQQKTISRFDFESQNPSCCAREKGIFASHFEFSPLVDNNGVAIGAQLESNHHLNDNNNNNLNDYDDIPFYVDHTRSKMNIDTHETRVRSIKNIHFLPSPLPPSSTPQQQQLQHNTPILLQCAFCDQFLSLGHGVRIISMTGGHSLLNSTNSIATTEHTTTLEIQHYIKTIYVSTSTANHYIPCCNTCDNVGRHVLPDIHITPTSSSITPTLVS